MMAAEVAIQLVTVFIVIVTQLCHLWPQLIAVPVVAGGQSSQRLGRESCQDLVYERAGVVTVLIDEQAEQAGRLELPIGTNLAALQLDTEMVARQLGGEHLQSEHPTQTSHDDGARRLAHNGTPPGPPGANCACTFGRMIALVRKGFGERLDKTIVVAESDSCRDK